MIGIRQHRIITSYNNIFDVQKLIFKLFLIFVLSKFRNWSQIPHSKDRVLFMLKKCLNIIFLQIWRKYINKLVFPEWAIHRIVQKWRMLNPKWSRSTGFLDLFYGKSEVSVKTLLIFLFYCGQVSRETFVKMVDILLSFFWHQKWNWLMVSWVCTKF